MSQRLLRTVRVTRECRRRKGAILSVEWLLVLPILIAVVFAITEFSLLWSTKHLLEAATYAAAREASLPAFSEFERKQAAIAAAERVLRDRDYVEGDPFDSANKVGYRFDEYSVGSFTGEPVTVSLSMPMLAAAPDLLQVIGLSIKNKRLTATTVIRRE